MSSAELTAEPFKWRRFLMIAGPGVVVMLANSDAGSLIAAAQSGAQWGYRMLALLLVLTPILYIVQELSVRLGMVTGKGLAQLIKERFGPAWAWVCVTALIVSCVGALLTELAGLTGVGALMGVPSNITLALAVTLLMLMTVTHSYLTLERIAIAVGAFELVFVLVAWLAHPSLREMAAGAISVPLSDPKYLYLVCANIGAVVMPWMVFFQQGSIVERRLTTRDLGAARLDTAIGAVVTQLITMAALVAVAATLGKAGGNESLETVEEIAAAITPYLGGTGGRIMFGLAMAGASLVAAIVVTLTAARSLGEVMAVKHSLDQPVSQAPWFYGAYAAALLVAAVVVSSGADLVALSVAVQVMNALLLPVVLIFLLLLARSLPRPYRLEGAYGWFSGAFIAATVALGIYSGLGGFWT
jgi:NRAMP (natural resistance-associated macrophage protein)-like metal ion transporter